MTKFLKTLISSALLTAVACAPVATFAQAPSSSGGDSSAAPSTSTGAPSTGGTTSSAGPSSSTSAGAPSTGGTTSSAGPSSSTGAPSTGGTTSSAAPSTSTGAPSTGGTTSSAGATPTAAPSTGGTTSSAGGSTSTQTPSTGGSVSSGSTSSGGGSSPAFIGLTNIRVQLVNPTTILVTWDSSMPTAGQVIYGPTSRNIPDGVAKNYGYQSATELETQIVFNHRAFVPVSAGRTTYLRVTGVNGTRIQFGGELAVTPTASAQDVATQNTSGSNSGTKVDTTPDSPVIDLTKDTNGSVLGSNGTSTGSNVAASFSSFTSKVRAFFSKIWHTFTAPICR